MGILNKCEWATPRPVAGIKLLVLECQSSVNVKSGNVSKQKAAENGETAFLRG